TAEIVAERLGCGVTVEPRLRERDAGEWQGRTREQIEEEWPGYLASGRRPPGFELDHALLVRVLDALAAVRGAHDGQAVFIGTPAGIVRTLERPLGDDDGGLLPNLGGRWVERGPDGDGWALGDRVLLLEDVTVTRPQQI